MPTIDLSTPPPAPDGTLDALPRRAALTLPELRMVAEAAGGAPLPFDVAEPGGGSESGALEDRLGQSRGTVEDQAYLEVLDSLHDPGASLQRRGLLVDGAVDEGLLGAVGLLATPRLALDVDIVADHVQGKAWHRQAGEAVATPVHRRRDRVRAGVVPHDLVDDRAEPGRGDPRRPRPA